MSPSKPAVSVILPTFNRSRKIQWTIESVLAQNLTNWELIVVSDASTDDTDEIIAAYTDPRIKHLRLPDRAGHPSEPRNRGLQSARAELIAYLDHDDAFAPGHLRNLIRVFSVRPDIDVVATGARFVDEYNTPQSESTQLDLMWHPELQTVGPIFQPSQVGVRRRAVEEVGGWTESRLGLEDWDLWWRLAESGFRFVTLLDCSALITRSGTSRISTVPIKWQIGLGALPDAAAAEHAHETLTSEAFISRIRTITRQESEAWYRALWLSGDLVVPTFSWKQQCNSTWEEIKERIDTRQIDEPFPPLRATPQPDGTFAVGIDLLAANEEHADAISRVMCARYPVKLDLIRQAMHNAYDYPVNQHIPREDDIHEWTRS